MKGIIILLFFLLITTGCKKENIQTEAEKVASQIAAIAQTNNITEAWVTVGSTPIISASTFKLEGEFIIVGGNYFNLNQLTLLKISGTAPNKYLDLYFNY